MKSVDILVIVIRTCRRAFDGLVYDTVQNSLIFVCLEQKISANITT